MQNFESSEEYNASGESAERSQSKNLGQENTSLFQGMHRL